MRLSISAKIFLGFLLLLATFGGVATYGAFTMRRLASELRLMSRGYLELRLEVSELQTSHSNLFQVISGQVGKDDARLPLVVKFAIDDARRVRLKQQMPKALAHLDALGSLRVSTEEQTLLGKLRQRLEQVQAQFRADEELFDEVFGPIGDTQLVLGDRGRTRVAAERLVKREQVVKRELANLSAELRLRAEQAGLRLEESESRAVWATLLLAVIAVCVGLAVMVMVTRSVRPLRRLAERAREIARGDYKKRVDASSGDEIGALGREFNSMAQALEEREQELIRSERLAAVGKIAAQITHEVRNPLSSIGLNAEMLEEELGRLEGPRSSIDEAGALARAIVKEVDRLTEITEQYLRFARLPRPKLEREELRAIVTSLLAFLHPELESRRVAVDFELPEGMQIAADEHQLRQALLNLLRNAAEAMREGGLIRLRAEREGDFIALSISDSGQGILPEHLSKIFDPFFSTKERGTGLGLALTQEIINEHGGHISVSSVVGAGTTFVVRLPALPATEGAALVLARERVEG